MSTSLSGPIRYLCQTARRQHYEILIRNSSLRNSRNPCHARHVRTLKSHAHESHRKGSRFGYTTFALVSSLIAGTIAWKRFSDDSLNKSTPLESDIENQPRNTYASVAELEKALKEIREQLKDDEDIISIDAEDLLAHGYSDWSPVNIDTLPVAVAYPKNTDDVRAIARICHKWRVPIIPYSGGSNIEGHTSAPFGGISLDFLHMDKILRLSTDDMDVTVQPGLCWTDLNNELKKLDTGLFFPIDPAPVAKIGGMVGTNCSGTNAVRYGTMRDWVLNVTMVMADGRVIKTRRRPRKCSAGYNLNGIIVGSEGTLGIVTEITLKLAPVPENVSVAVVPFPNVHSAVSAATKIIQKGIPVAALELMDAALMRMVNEGKMTLPRVWKETPTLFLKFSGTKDSVADNIQTVQRLVTDYGPSSFEFAKDSREQEILWSARKESLLSLLALRKEGEELWNTDVAVPLSRLADIIVQSQEEARDLGLNVCIKGHIGDSNFHENITYNKQIPEEAAKAHHAVKSMVRRAISMEGTCTGEHGIGFGKKDGLLMEVGEETLSVMKMVKRAFDPHWILNPGKIFDQ